MLRESSIHGRSKRRAFSSRATSNRRERNLGPNQMKESFMKQRDSHGVSANTVTYKAALVDGLNIAYREAGDQQNPKLVLLHGFPASSHQYRNLITDLAGNFHVIAP